MIVEITGLERGTKMSKKGKPLSMMTLTGIKIVDGEPEGDYERVIYDWKNEDEIQALEEAGIGATVNLWFTKNGRFQDLDRVEVMEKGTGVSSGGTGTAAKKSEEKPASKPQSSGAGGTAGKTVSQTVVSSVATTKETIRAEAMLASVKLTAAMLNAPERFKKVLAATKTDAEILMQLTLENASKFVAFIKGKDNSKVESDAKDLDKEGVDADEPSLPGEDD